MGSILAEGPDVKKKFALKATLESIVSYASEHPQGEATFLSPVHSPENIRIYRILKSGREDGYEADHILDYSLDKKGTVLHIIAKADGFYLDDETPHLELFRYSSTQPGLYTENSDLLGRSLIRCMGYLYCLREDADHIGLRLTWYHSHASSAVSSVSIMTRSELKEDFDRIISSYMIWLEKLKSLRLERDKSLKNIAFPFPEKRKGQDEFMDVASQVIQSSSRGFIQAPTGIGKTTGSIYPAVKSLCNGEVEKIFFLTARTISRTVAEHAFDVLRKAGAMIKTVTLTAKEKVCSYPENFCRPEKCPYARGYHDRVVKVLEEMLHHEHFGRTLIMAYADKHQLCPFELSLDLSLWVDVIICDYNYVFDPGAYLRRYFEEGKGEYLFLVDEAHNLVDRAREMFSAELDWEEFKTVNRLSMKGSGASSLDCDDLFTCFERRSRECAEENQAIHVMKHQDRDFIPALKVFMKSMEDLVEREENRKTRETYMDLYFSCLKYLRVAEVYDDNYLAYATILDEGKNLSMRLFCLDPSTQLKLMMDKGRASLLFSATLSPLEYHAKLLGGSSQDSQIAIPSPFPRKNLALLVADSVSTKFTARESTLPDVVRMVRAVLAAKKGNYLVYFPSYKYLNMVYERLPLEEMGLEVLLQKPKMSEREKEEFLKKFSADNERTLLGMAVLGGMFSESIDLAGDKLSGAIIVGVGMPQICDERDIIRAFFEEKYGKGFEYAYIYPGMNKVLQAAGRVIRTEKDRGVVLLIDDRYAHRNYRELFPSHWNHPVSVSAPEEVESFLSEFWRCV